MGVGNYDQAAVLREVADELFENAYHYSALKAHAASALQFTHWGEALRLVAVWLDAQVGALRAPGDPLLITNDRGDRVTRGVEIVIGAFLLERFGTRLSRTAATLAAVALGMKTNARAIRSAFSKRKSV